MRKRLISLCVLPFLALAACGGGDGDTSATDSTSGSTATSIAPPTSALRSASGADLESAKKLVLLPADFPAGWTSEPAEQSDDADDEAASDEFEDCLGVGGDDSGAADWSGDDFSMDSSEAGSSASVVRDEATYQDDIEVIRGPLLPTCLEDMFTRLLTDQVGTAPTAVDVAPLEVTEYGDVTVGFRVTITVSARGETLTFYADLVLMGKDRAEVFANFFGVGQPFDPALQESLLAKLGSRLDAV